MFKFFTVSEKMMNTYYPKNIEHNYVYIYMVWEWHKYVWEGKKRRLLTSKHKFNLIDWLMKESFESLTIVKHNKWIWFWVDIDELIEMWIKNTEKFFLMEWKELYKLKI